MQIRGHKRVFIINAVRMALLLFVLDFAVASGMKSLFLKQRSGKHSRITHSITETRTDVLIFGSSHAIRHFVPSRFAETLGLSCYNGGVQGKGILFTHALQTLILDRYSPKVIVLNIEPDMLYASPVQYDRLYDLLPYYETHRELLEPFMAMKSRFENVKMISRIYPYNSTIVHIVRYWIAPQMDFDGYRPLHGQMPESLLEKQSPDAPAETRGSVTRKLDENFIAALAGFISNAAESGAKLYFVVSPLYVSKNYGDNESFTRIKQIAETNGIPILDYSHHEQFLGNHTLFKDEGHLNHEGALLFSSLAAEELGQASRRLP